MSTISAGYYSNYYSSYSKKETEKSKSETNSFALTAKAKVTEGRGNSRVRGESVVDRYKKRHPDSVAHVNRQVVAGEAVRKRNGAENVNVDDMTMEEYKKYFYALLDTIPYDATRVNDEEIICISDKGWEQMKKDPDYEAWVLGYFSEDRAVRNPFAGWGGDSGMISIEHFGASIEEHHGEGYSKAALKGPKSDDKNSWWVKRQKRMKELHKEQAKRAYQRAKARSAEGKQQYMMHRLGSQQRLESFLRGEPISTQPNMISNQSAATAFAAYDSIIDLFSNNISRNV
ncbi:MAG: hypothetical protein K2G89_05640 [Lachnospiraceae bacterium]|nr:hypothetical protein [Lachnospiraceae bacterium]